MAANNIKSFVIEKNEKLIFAGNKLGEVLVIDADSFALLNRKHFHYGSISAMDVHPKYNYLTLYGFDGYLSILKFNLEGELFLIHSIETRNIKPENDHFKRGPSTSQAVAFHPEKLRLASRGGTAGIFELEFDDQQYKILHCKRLHDNHDVVTLRYTGEGDKLLSAANTGGGITFSENGKIINKWYHKNAIHWFEKIDQERFYVASDARKILYLNVNNPKENHESEILTKEHCEHVTYNKQEDVLFITSFDRKVRKVDPKSLKVLNIIWQAPYKCRWLHHLNKNPNLLIVQCRNGALYKIDIAENTCIQSFKETPPALWSAVVRDNELIAAGDGDYYLSYKPNSINQLTKITKFSETQHFFDSDKNFYTKCVRKNINGLILFGRSNGDIIANDGKQSYLLCKLPDAIRDIDFYGENYAFIACEDGCLYQINLTTQEKQTCFSSAEPIWALAVNQTKKQIAFGNRLEQLYLYDIDKNETNIWRDEFGFMERMIWRDDDNLLLAAGSFLYSCDFSDKSKKLFLRLPNTIEDFAWDPSKKYLVLVSYTRFIYLLDFKTGELLHQQADMIDYSYGVVFLGEKLSPYLSDFVVLSRAGKPSYHRIHDERIISYGFLS